MKFCQSHWDRLRIAIETRGMGHLVASSGKEAARRLVSEIEGMATDATYDPLMAAHNMVVSQAIEIGGLYLMTGDYCPVCEAVTHHPAECCSPEQIESLWIDGPADAVLAYCREKGLIRNANEGV